MSVIFFGKLVIIKTNVNTHIKKAKYQEIFIDEPRSR